MSKLARVIRTPYTRLEFLQRRCLLMASELQPGYRSRLKAWLVRLGMEGKAPRWVIFAAINVLGLRGA